MRAATPGPIVRTVTPTLTPPLRTLQPVPARPQREREREFRHLPPAPAGPANWVDPALQHAPARGEMASPVLSVDGITNACGCAPPDSEGDVGLSHYMEWDNLHYRIYNKAGAPLTAVTPGNTLFSSLGPAESCRVANWGDPLVQYDQLADRWVVSQFAGNDVTGFGPYYECVAVSQTSDPTGAWYLYPFQTSATVFPDYPKMGVWPDAYYFSFAAFPDVQFTDGQLFSPGVMAVERAKMLAGQPAQQVYFDHENLPALNENMERMLPSDLDGPTLPPANEPNYFLQPDTSTNNELEQWEFHVDWTTPANSTFLHTNTISVPAFDPTVSCANDDLGAPRRCVPQPGTTEMLDAFVNPGRQRLMYELNYRNFGTHRSLVANHNVDAGTNHVSTRWYEIRNPETNPTTHYQASTYAPDTDHRWMGAVAQDRNGNLAVGYSVSSGTTFPSLRYAGRLATDPLHQLTQGEATLVAGGGSQTGPSRWGDYSHMSVDPLDDCTFWYIGEYYSATSSSTWKTRIGSFRFPGCSGSPTSVQVKALNARWQGKAVSVTWQTSAETGIAGFNVYRSIGTKPFRKINASLVAAKKTGRAAGASYRFVDRGASRLTAATYRLQVVKTNGKRSWYAISTAAAPS